MDLKDHEGPMAGNQVLPATQRHLFSSFDVQLDYVCPSEILYRLARIEGKDVYLLPIRCGICSQGVQVWCSRVMEEDLATILVPHGALNQADVGGSVQADIVAKLGEGISCGLE